MKYTHSGQQIRFYGNGNIAFAPNYMLYAAYLTLVVFQILILLFPRRFALTSYLFESPELLALHFSRH